MGFVRTIAWQLKGLSMNFRSIICFLVAASLLSALSLGHISRERGPQIMKSPLVDEVAYARTGTFSIVAIDPDTGEAAVAVASKFPAVGTVVPFVKAGVGAFATQCNHNPEWGPKALEMLERKMHPGEVIAALVKDDPQAGTRQLAAIDMQGRGANHNPFAEKGGARWWGSQAGQYYSCQGNTLTSMPVIQEMARTFETTKGVLADRLMAVLLAADAAGGDHRGRQAAAIVIANPRQPEKPFILRVDDDKDAVNALKAKYDEYKKQTP
jgi:uncharacterized Ntn-hydrolase superfamily protein